MKKKVLWIALLALLTLLPFGSVKADGAPLLIAPGPAAESDKPFWYPQDTSNFQFFTDATAPRVADYADIFTDEEEAAILQAIGTQSARGGADIVVVTDSSSYGMSHREYADDFYDYNGYGFGKDRDGIVLFICMEAGNRGWWTSVTGRLDPAVSSGPVLYTETVANALDDALYDYMVSGRYAEGVIDWVGNVGTWLVYGVPFAPLWYPTVEEQAVWVRERNASAARIVDNAGFFAGSEASALQQKAKDLSDTYGVDVVIHAAKNDCGMGKNAYAQAFYQYGGYGLYSDYSGILLVMFGDGSQLLYTEGEVPSCLNDYETVERLLDMSGEAAAGGAAKGAEKYLSLLEKALKNNRIPHSSGSWIMGIVMAALGGLIPGAISRGSASASMKTVRTAFNSNDYLVDGSFRVNSGNDVYVGVTTSRVYSPQSKSSSSEGGSSGGSTYSGGHTSSSGSSHSGSGRKF